MTGSPGSLLRPLPPSEVFELIQAGYPADAVLLITTRAVNGIYNRSGIGARAREADPEFYPILDALRRLQLSGAVSIRLEKRGSEDIGRLILASKRATEVSQDLQFVPDLTRRHSGPGWRDCRQLWAVTARPERDCLAHTFDVRDSAGGRCRD